jgi:hypothetical protein
MAVPRFPFTTDDSFNFFRALADIHRANGEEVKAAAIERRAEAWRDRERLLEDQLADALTALEDAGVVPREDYTNWPATDAGRAT